MGIICAAPCCDMCPCVPCCGYTSHADLTIHPLHHWFEMVAKNNPELKLSQLCAVSSHDSGTYTIPESKCCSGVSRTQTLDLYGQLMAGARHLDYRYGPLNLIHPEALVVQHGIHFGENYYKQLEGVSRFFKENPNEFIILDCNIERKITNDQKRYLIDYLVKHFGSFAITMEDMRTWCDFPSVKIGEILKRPNKRVLLLVDRYMFQYEEKPGTQINDDWLKEKGIFNRDYMLESWWQDNCIVDTVLKQNFKHIQDRPQRKDQLGKIMSTQYILTPQTTKMDIVKYLFGAERLRIDQKQYLLLRDKSLQVAIREASELPTMNFVMLDFVHYAPYMNHYIIGLNLKEKLHICKAVASNRLVSVDVTERVRNLVKRDNSLWIISFKKDLDIKFEIGTLMIAFTQGDELHGSENPLEVCKTEFFDFDQHSQYLLNGLRGKLDNALPLSAFTNDPTLKQRHQEDVKAQEFLNLVAKAITPNAEKTGR